MTDRSSPIQNDEVLDYLRTDIVVPAADAKRRIADRLCSSIAALGRGGELSSDDHHTATMDEASVDSAADANGPCAVRLPVVDVDPGRSWLRSLVQRPVAFGIAAFSIGAASGAGILAAWQRHAPASSISAPALAVRNVETPRLASGDGPPSAIDPPKEDPLPSTMLPERSGASPRSNPARPSASRLASLAAQQALLDQARAALARGDDDAALQTIELHRRRYPNSIMSEEREALAIKALVGRADYAEAKTRGARFREHYPRSLLLPSIEETLATIP
jgi:hypothetical protein